jgi:hypothetical protein
MKISANLGLFISISFLPEFSCRWAAAAWNRILIGMGQGDGCANQA